MKSDTIRKKLKRYFTFCFVFIHDIKCNYLRKTNILEELNKRPCFFISINFFVGPNNPGFKTLINSTFFYPSLQKSVILIL